MDIKNNLTHLQYVALEGEVGFALGTAAHKDEMLLRMYLMLKNAPKKYKPYLLKAIKENVDLPEEDVERISFESEASEPPMWLWVNRTVSDIKLSLLFGEPSIVPRELRLPVKKKELREKVVASSYILFARKISMVCSDAAKALVEAVINDNDLEFMHLASFALLGEIAELQDYKKSKPFTEDLLIEFSFDPREPLSFIAEKKAIEEPVDNIKSILETIEEADAKEKKKEEPSKVEYEVVKVFQDVGVSTTLRKFKTEEEAVAFIEDIKVKYPEVLEKTPIIIIKKEMK